MTHAHQTARQGPQIEGPALIAADKIEAQQLHRPPEPGGSGESWLDEKDYPGLPVIWIENQELLGAQTDASLRAAWQRAERHKFGNGL